MTADPKPRCECNVFTGNPDEPIAWRTWACPLHKWGGWLDKHDGEGEPG